MGDVPSHHLVYGKCADFLTGEELVDTDDERYRQKIAKFLVEELGYEKGEITPRLDVTASLGGRTVMSRIDFAVSLEGRIFMIIRYGPGSLVSRERSAVAAARVLVPAYRVPLAVVTNGRDAELIDSADGRVLAGGLAAIPHKERALDMIDDLDFLPFSYGDERQRELRILNAFDFEACCTGAPCASSEK